MSEERSRILVLGTNDRVRDEFTTALDSSPAPSRPRVSVLSDERQLVEAARAVRPELVLVPLELGVWQLRALAGELEAVSDATMLVAMVEPGSATGDGDARPVIDALRAGVHDFLHRPASSTEISEILSRWHRRSRDPGPSSASVVSFVSNKGGVGKSTLAVNTAVDLALRSNLRVLLVDLSLQLGVCGSMLRLSPQTTILDAAREWDRLDETMLYQLSAPHPSGLRLLAAPPRAQEAAEIGSDAVTRILGLAQRVFDVVIVDTFPLLDAVVVSVLDASDLAYVVVQGFVPTIIGASSLLGTLEAIGQPDDRLRIVLSRNHASFAGSLSATDIEQRLGRRVDHDIPYYKGLLACANTGRPAALTAWRAFGFGKALSGLSDEVRTLWERSHDTAPP